ncbi:MAG: hypothetical protein ACLQF0_15500 [Dissulfurispiraceae bacterium]
MSWLWRLWFWLMCEGDKVTPATTSIALDDDYSPVPVPLSAEYNYYFVEDKDL